MAAPQYGGSAPAPSWPAPAPAAPAWGGGSAASSAAPAITAAEWSSLNPYGNNIAAYPANEQAQIAEIQAQWDKFLPYLPYLKGMPGNDGAPGTFPFNFPSF